MWRSELLLSDLLDVAYRTAISDPLASASRREAEVVERDAAAAAADEEVRQLEALKRSLQGNIRGREIALSSLSGPSAQALTPFKELPAEASPRAKQELSARLAAQY